MNYRSQQDVVIQWKLQSQALLNGAGEMLLMLSEQQQLKSQWLLPCLVDNVKLPSVMVDEALVVALKQGSPILSSLPLACAPIAPVFSHSEFLVAPLFLADEHLFGLLVCSCPPAQLTAFSAKLSHLLLQFEADLANFESEGLGKKLQAAFSQFPLAYYLLSPSGILQDFQAGRYEPFQLDVRESLGLPLCDVVSADNAHSLNAALMNMQGGAAEQVAMLHFKEPSPERTYAARLSRISEHTLLLELQDNTQQQLYVQQLQAQEKHYHSLFDSTGIGLAVVDAQGHFKQVNHIFAKLLGLAEAQLIGQEIWPHVHQGHRKQLQYWHKLRNSQYQGTLPRSFECVYHDGEGKARWASVGVSPALDSDCYIVSALDITHSKRAEEELNLAAKVFNNTVEGVVICDSHNRIIQVNDAFCRITGFSRREVVGQTPQVLASGYHDQQFYQEMWATIQSDGQWRGEIRNRRKDGSVYPELLTISAVYDEDGQISNYVGAFSDISQLKRSEERLRYLASHDVLTDLPNRLMLIESLEAALVQAQRNQSMLAVAFIDVDHFKKINDSLGHATGDALLIDVSRRLLSSLRKSDQLARIGGDEFVVLLRNVNQPSDVTQTMHKLLEKLDEPLLINEHQVRVTLSAGVSLYPQDGEDVDSLLKNADAAMYSAKDRGRNNFQFYTKELTSQAFEHLLLESALQQALQQQQFRLCYQPLVTLHDSRIIGFEVLLRWHHPELGEVAPGRFIPVAEKTGLVVPIGEWVLKQACFQAQQWLQQGIALSTIAVNVSGAQLQNTDFLGVVKTALAESQLPAECLELELTESVVMQHSEHSFALLNQLKALGLKLSVDDFGTGYSSLSYLSALPIDKLKIDRSFINKMLDDKQNRAIADAVIGLGKALELPVLAEGIEQAEQVQLLRQRECQYAQGYFYSPPLEQAQIPEFLRHYQAPI